MTIRALFILKHRQPGQYGSWSYSTEGKPLASGLSVSATQMAKALDELFIENKLVHVVDNNCIDREVHLYKPTHVFIEAFWVVPEKFAILKKLHPTVTWVVRNHSKSDFLSAEGGMIGWAIDYMKAGVVVASNSPSATMEFKNLARAAGADPAMSVYLPNFYECDEPEFSPAAIWFGKALRWLGINEPEPFRQDVMQIGCFGAIRPMKNHLTQAIAAIACAEALGVELRFWINANRVEGKADSQLRSIRALFERFPQHKLLELGWMPHPEFLEVVSTMDLVMQVSVSETFNIVGADAVASGIPLIGSDEIPWLGREFTADPGNPRDIARAILHAWRNRYSGLFQAAQLQGLNRYVEKTKRIWSHYMMQSDHTHCCK